jgi:Icc-related predicted phosphoesterase
MTHGPPHSILDQVDGQNLGCPNLLHAVSRTKPLMHCFGHIHEGHGANIVIWTPDGSVKDPTLATPLETEQINDIHTQTNGLSKLDSKLFGQRRYYDEHL